MYKVWKLYIKVKNIQQNKYNKLENIKLCINIKP